ncbi:MAG: hypothetical protein KY448_13595 [Cyanobacteria bacterium 0813]|nr:hypothetical protein [Cyanobacteria bacterium 0813]
MQLHPNDTGVRAFPLGCAEGNQSATSEGYRSASLPPRFGKLERSIAVLNQLLCGGLSGGAGPAVGFKCCNSLWGFFNFGRSDF